MDMEEKIRRITNLERCMPIHDRDDIRDFEALETAIEAIKALDEIESKFRNALKELAEERLSSNSVLEDIKAEIKEWYWQADKQAIAKDPCVVDAMIDLFIRTIDAHISSDPQERSDKE